MSRKSLNGRVAEAAEAALAEQRYVSATEVLVGLGWLTPSHIERWRQGRIESLESLAPVDPSKVADALAALQRWGQDRRLIPSETEYVARTRDRRPLRFSVSGDGEVRRANEDVRFSADFAAAIRSEFPGCPASRADAIARHAATRGSGRIGRSAAGRALDPDAVRLAVAASARHVDTNYDELLMSGVDRESARQQVHERVEDVLSGWRAITT